MKIFRSEIVEWSSVGKGGGRGVRRSGVRVFERGGGRGLRESKREGSVLLSRIILSEKEKNLLILSPCIRRVRIALSNQSLFRVFL